MVRLAALRVAEGPPARDPQAVRAELLAASTRLGRIYRDVALDSVPGAREMRRILRDLGADPRSSPPRCEILLRRALGGRPPPEGGPVADLIGLVSLSEMLPVFVYRERGRGDLTVRTGRAGESVRRGANEIGVENRVVVCDAAGPLCCPAADVGAPVQAGESDAAVFLAFGPSDASRADMLAAAARMEQAIERYLGRPVSASALGGFAP